MGERAAAQPPQREDHQLAVGYSAVHALEIGHGRLGEQANRGLGDAGIAGGNVERIARAADDLRAESKALFADHAPNVIEQPLIIAVNLTATHLGSQRRDIAYRIERAGVDQPVEQLRPPAQCLGKRRGVAQNGAEQARERRLRFEQPEEVDHARQAPQDLVEPGKRRIGIRGDAERGDKAGHGILERCARRRTAQRGIIAAAPPFDPPHPLTRIAVSECRQLRGQTLAVAGKGIIGVTFERIVKRSHALDVRSQEIEQRISAAKAVQASHRIQRRARGQAVGLPIVDHLHAVLDRAQQGVSVDQRGRIGGIDPACPSQRRQRVARSGNAKRRIAAAVDQLMNLGEELDLTNAASPALEVIARTKRLALRMMIADQP